MAVIPTGYYPAIEPGIDPVVGKHLRQIYQKLLNHSQAVGVLTKQIAANPTTTSTTATSAASATTVTGSVTQPTLTGKSPTGQTSVNSSATAATQSSYGIDAFISGTNFQSGASYSVQNSDYNGLVIFNTASVVAISLNSAVTRNFTCSIFNIGSAAMTLTPTSGTVNLAAFVMLQTGAFAQVFFDGTNWWALSFTGVLPATFTPVLHEFLTGYNATTGALSAAQPAFTDISGSISYSQLPLYPYASKTANYTLTTSDYQIECTANSFTLTLPSAVGISGQVFSMKNSGTGTITVSGLIDGATFQTLAQWDNLQVMSNGATYIII